MASMPSSSIPPPSGRALLWGILRRHRGRLALSVLLLSLWTAGEALVPAVVGGTIDAAIATPDARALAIWLGLLALTFATLSYGFRYGSRIANRVVNQETHVLRTRVADRALDPRGGNRRRLPGEIAALASVDADVAGSFVRQVALGISAGLGLMVCAGYLLATSPWLGALVLVLAPLSLLALRALTPLLTRRTAEAQESIAAATGSVADLLRGAEVLRGVGAQAEAASWYRGRSRAATAAAIRTAGPSARLEAAHVLAAGLILVAVAAVGGWQVVDGSLSAGDLIGIMGVAAFLSTPLGVVVALLEGLARSRAAADRIAAFLAEPVLRTGEERPAPRADATLVLSWDASEVTVQGGSFLAIVCADATAPARFGEAIQASSDAARLRVDGTDWERIDPLHAPLVLRLPPHVPHVFEGTVRSNVVGASAEDIPAAVWHASGVQDMVENFAHGTEHVVHAGGENLSGGQRQRLALARALAGPCMPRVLVEPTTAVDSVTEAGIASALMRWRDAHAIDGTLAVFTSSPVIAGTADSVAFVQEGGVVRRGTHHELLLSSDYREAVGR